MQSNVCAEVQTMTNMTDTTVPELSDADIERIEGEVRRGKQPGGYIVAFTRAVIAADRALRRDDDPNLAVVYMAGRYDERCRSRPAYPLPDDLYPDSKDWQAGNYAERVEWLHRMYEAKKREADMWCERSSQPTDAPALPARKDAPVGDPTESDEHYARRCGEVEGWNDCLDALSRPQAAKPATDAQPSAEPGDDDRAPTDLIGALRFYAEQGHFGISDESAWDTVSGEPQNYWCDEAGTATVEDGSIARRALELAGLAHPAPAEQEGVREADARLIAELLEVLQAGAATARELGLTPSAMTLAAIAKATRRAAVNAPRSKQ